MIKRINTLLLIALMISIPLYFYPFKEGLGYDVPMKVLYFSKDRLIIIGLLFYIWYSKPYLNGYFYEKKGKKLIPVLWAIACYCIINLIYESMLITLSIEKYSKLLKSTLISSIVSGLILIVYVYAVWKNRKNR